MLCGLCNRLWDEWLVEVKGVCGFSSFMITERIGQVDCVGYTMDCSEHFSPCRFPLC